MTISTDNATLLAEAQAAAHSKADPEGAIHALARVFFERLGDRAAHEKPDALAPGQEQYFVGGAFLVTPDRTHLMLVGNIGFPAEQKRLLVPIDGGNPGQVIASGQPLLLEDTTVRSDFRQYLKTSRMGSAIYAPLIVSNDVIGLIIMAAQARWTFSAPDLDALVCVSRVTADAWIRLGGPEWLAREYADVQSRAASQASMG